MTRPTRPATCVFVICSACGSLGRIKDPRSCRACERSAAHTTPVFRFVARCKNSRCSGLENSIVKAKK